MATTILQLYASISGTGDGVASLDVPEDGEIMGIDWDMVGTAGFQSADAIQAQLSFLASSQFVTNDARGAISSCGLAVGLVSTNGTGGGIHAQKFVSMEEGLNVSGGERLHLHALLVGVATTETRCLVHLKTKRTAARRSRRRR